MSKITLTEIKKGQTGTGLLIENDGFISMNLKENKPIMEAYQLSEENGIREIPRPFIVSAVFQKYGIENANGRIYPEAILKREVEKYMQVVKERRGYGECYTPNVLCLTKNGWKPLGEVKAGDEVLTLNTDTEKIEIKKVTNKISHNFSGKMLRIKGRNINDLVTPEHKFPVFGRTKFKGYYSASQMKDGFSDMKHSSLKKTGEWTNKGDDIFTLKGLTEPSKKILHYHPDCKDDVQISMSTFMKFMGIYLSEGYFSKRGCNVVITQKKENICSLIEELLEEMGLKYTIYNRSTNIKDYKINDPRLHRYVSELGDCYTKYIPVYIKQQSKENLRLLYDWFVLGDGRIRGDKRSGKSGNLTDDVFSSSMRLIEDLNEIQLKIGYNGSLHTEKRNNDRIIEGREIKGENCKPLNFTLRSLSKNIWLDTRFIEIKEEDYDGEVQCIDVEDNHNWYVMSNGFCHWTGNCNHPDSTNIDLSRIAMNIVELHWENQTLVGKIELPITEGFRKFGIISCQIDQVAHLILSGLKIGVSSRGLGSVEQQYGKLIVGDDYEIVCWDVVAQPSTPNAWIDIHEENLQQYVESKQSDKQVIKEDKFSKFDSWLNG